MSKIDCESSKPLTFGELEDLTVWLTNEMFIMQKDLFGKCEIFNESQSAINAHENMLFKIDEAIKIVRSAIETVERELQLMECAIQVIGHLVQQLQMVQCTDTWGFNPKPKAERENFLKPLYEIDENILHLQTALFEVEEAMRQGSGQPLTPLITLCKILNRHQETLCSTAKKIDLIMDKLFKICIYKMSNTEKKP